jgi:hypothetical protein
METITKMRLREAELESVGWINLIQNLDHS